LIFVWVLSRTAASGGSTSSIVQARVLQKAQEVTAALAVKQAQSQIDAILDTMEESVRTVVGDGAGVKTFAALVEAMRRDLKTSTRGRYAGQAGLIVLMEDVTEVVDCGTPMDLGGKLLHIAGGFAGPHMIRATGDLVVDLVEILSEDEHWEVEPDDIELVRVAVRVMATSVANRDLLVARTQSMLTMSPPTDVHKLRCQSGDAESVCSIQHELRCLVFLLCTDVATITQLLEIALRGLGRSLLAAGVPEKDTKLLPPLAAAVAKTWLRGSGKAYSPEEVLEMMGAVQERAAGDPAAAGQLVLGMAQQILGKKAVDLILTEAYERGTAASGDVASGDGDSGGSAVGSLRAKVRRYFDGYDLNMSGTINSNDERGQLVLALIFDDMRSAMGTRTSVKMPFTRADIKADLARLDVEEPLNDDNAWTPCMLENWYTNYRSKYGIGNLGPR